MIKTTPAFQAKVNLLSEVLARMLERALALPKAKLLKVRAQRHPTKNLVLWIVLTSSYIGRDAWLALNDREFRDLRMLLMDQMILDPEYRTVCELLGYLRTAYPEFKWEVVTEGVPVIQPQARRMIVMSKITDEGFLKGLRIEPYEPNEKPLEPGANYD